MATLLDVAKKANVSKMTVSRVINHPERVTDGLKALVFLAMDELDYRPNNAAKALAQNRTLVVKVMILEEMDTTEPYYMNLLMGISKELDKSQYSLQLLTENSVDLGECDGYIITGMRENDYGWIKELKKPVVLFGENKHGLTFADSDNEGGTEKATRYAIDVGYKTIVYIGMEVDGGFERSREAGYKKVLTEYGKQPITHCFDNHSTLSATFIRENMAQFERNTCFICSTDRLALGIQLGLLQAGKQIPEDYGVIGFDGVFLDQIATPKLTTVKQAVTEMGSMCAQLLLKKIQNPDLGLENCLHDTTLVVRGSTRKKKETTE